MALLTETEPGRRNRRTSDSVLLVWAAIVIGLSAAIASSAPGHDRDVAEALRTVFGWAGALWRTALFGLLGLAAAIVVAVLVRRRWGLARDLLVAAVGLVGAAVLLGQAVEPDWLPFEAHLLARWGYPELRLAGATAVIVVVGPELVRTVAWSPPASFRSRLRGQSCSAPRARPLRLQGSRSVWAPGRSRE